MHLAAFLQDCQAADILSKSGFCVNPGKSRSFFCVFLEKVAHFLYTEKSERSDPHG